MAHVRVDDTDRWKPFKAVSGPAIASLGGGVLIRIPGSAYPARNLRGLTIMIEFDGLDQARAFYGSEASTSAPKLLEEAAETDLLLV